MRSPLFGYGLSYTAFALSNLHVSAGWAARASSRFTSHPQGPLRSRSGRRGANLASRGPNGPRNPRNAVRGRR